MVCGMGGSAIGGDLAAAALGDRLTRPLADGPRLRAAELGDAGVDGPLLQLLGQHRGDAGLLRRRRGARRPPHRRQHRRRPGRPGPRGGRPGGRPAGDLPAPRRRRLHVRHRRRGGRAGRRRAALHTEIDAAAAFLEARAEALQTQRGRDRRRLEGAVPVDLRRRPDRARSRAAGRPRSTRTPSCPPSSPSCPRPTTTRSAAGPAGAEGRFAAVFLEDRDQHPRERRRFELTAGCDRRRGGRRGPGRDRGRDPRRPPALGDDAGRPGLARARRARGASTRSRSRRSSASRRRWAA